MVLFAAVVMFGEILPKTLAKKNPKNFSLKTLPFL
ncbi:MAG: hypothetical protein COZ15_01700, partial [Elusimicrobia bacterium CG_4_10_14_3_um_filter_49_12_50_7]